MAASFTKKYYLLPIWRRNKTIVELKTVTLAWATVKNGVKWQIPRRSSLVGSKGEHPRANLKTNSNNHEAVQSLKRIARARAARFLSIHSSSSFSGLNDFLFVFPIKLISWVFRMLTSNHSAIHPEYLSKTAIFVNWSSLVFSLAWALRSFPWTHPRTTSVHDLGYLVSAYPRKCWICLGGVD